MRRISTKTGRRHAIRPGRRARQGRKRPGANTRKFPSLAAVERRINRAVKLADRIAAGKAEPETIAKLSGEDALMVLLSLRYSDNLPAVGDELVEALSLRYSGNLPAE